MENLKFKEILNTLSEGNARFVSGRYKGPDTSPAHRKSLLKGQRPMAAMVACADSRVSPEIIFDQGLGDLFIVRTVSRLNQMEQFATLVAEQTLLICGAIYHLEDGKVRFI